MIKQAIKNQILKSHGIQNLISKSHSVPLNTVPPSVVHFELITFITNFRKFQSIKSIKPIYIKNYGDIQKPRSVKETRI